MDPSFKSAEKNREGPEIRDHEEEKIEDQGEGSSVTGSGATIKQKKPSTGVGTSYQFITARQLQAQAKQMQEARKMVKKNNEEAPLEGFLGSGSNQAT